MHPPSVLAEIQPTAAALMIEPDPQEDSLQEDAPQAELDLGADEAEVADIDHMARASEAMQGVGPGLFKRAGAGQQGMHTCAGRTCSRAEFTSCRITMRTLTSVKWQ